MITPSFSLTATERVLPKLALDFTTASLDPRVTFTRAGNTATYTNSSGLIVSATNNQPRFDYNPISLVCKGLLIEETRTNILIGSDGTGSFGNTTSLTFSAITVPDGTSVNCVWNSGGNSTNRYEVVINGGVYASGTNFVWSWYQKKINTTETGAVITPQSLINATVVSAPAKIQDFNNGWERWSTSLSITDGAVLTRFRMYITAPSLGVYNAFAVWGNQIEAGAFATSYIPTTTTALARNADVATMTGTNFSDWYNASEGCISGTAIGQAPIANDSPIAYICNAALSLRFIYLTRRETNLGGVYNGTVQAALNDGTAVTINDVVNCTMSYLVNNIRGARNGHAAVSDLTSTIPTVDSLYIGRNQAQDTYLNGWVKKLATILSG